MKPIIIDQAVKLRKQGMLYSDIAKRLNIPKSTAYSWLKNVKLTDRETYLVQEVLLASKRKIIPTLNHKRQVKLEAVEKDIQLHASKILLFYDNHASSNIVALSMLFWGEGEKDLSGGVRFINSDPAMIELYLGLLRRCVVLDESKLKVQLHVHEYHDIGTEIRFWSKVTGITATSFYRPYQKMNTGKRKKNDYHGTVSIRYSDSRLGKLLKMVYTDFGKTIGV